VDIPQGQKDAALLEVLENLDRLEAEHLKIIDAEQPLVRRGKVVTDP